MKVFKLMLAVIGMVVFLSQPSFSEETNKDTKLIGSWSMTLNSTDASGKPCPFVPDSMKFYKDKTMIMSNFGSGHLPFKTSLTEAETQAIELRNPGLKGKKLLLVKPNPNVDWSSTPMVYAYSVEKDELTLILQGWSPAKFKRTAK